MQISNNGQMSSISDGRVALIRGMVARGDRQVDVAMWHQISPSTVNRICKDKKYRPGVLPSLPTELPPPGPYTIIARDTLTELQIAGLVRDRVVHELRRLLQSLEGETTNETVQHQ